MHAGECYHVSEMSDQRKEHSLSLRQRRLLGTALIILAVLFMGLMIYYVGRPMVQMAKDPAAFQAYIQRMGPSGILLFAGMIILQVIVAVIPGGPFQVAAGYAFGVLGGSLLCDLATTVGSVLVFLLTRRYGRRFIELFFSDRDIDSVQLLKMDERKDLLIFLLFLVPGTPKDLLSYLVGLTDMPLRRWILIAAVGRFPAILLSAMSGSAVSTGKYREAAIVMALILALSIAGMVFYRKRNQKR